MVLNGGLYRRADRQCRARSARCRCPTAPGGPAQLIDVASLVLLERRLRAAGLPHRGALRSRRRLGGLRRASRRLAGDAARGIAHAIAAAPRVVDFEAAVIDGAFPPRCGSG